MANTTQKAPPTPPTYNTGGGTMPSTYGSPNAAMWNTAFHAGPAAQGGPGTKPSWNVRFDYAPSSAGRTYDGKKMAAIGPAPMNKAKS